MLYILVPSLLLRLHGYFKYRKSDPLDFKDYSSYIYVFYHGSYGLWTIYNIFRYMGVSQNCKELRSMSMINYEVALIIGCFPAVNVLFVGLILTILVPMLIYQQYKQYRERQNHVRRTQLLLESLISKPYSNSLFKENVECSICLDYFFESSDNTCLVTPMPCSNMHTFHTECIKPWLLQHNNCPLCKTNITLYDI